ncbi:CRAL/TRIO domain-containing protein [Setomelanomma holmii]|uniref:CRAL/TRIO domain-containing protein n=1 Tax=Setomelanomma holmii TaxID=210430 RepID=A0A9P4HFL6_9PLEO|nr:CRAL/TRIO domain-containing protein [Setomelanomma holmii]
MSLRAQPHRRLLHTATTSVLKYRPSIHSTKHFIPRPVKLTSNTCAYSRRHHELRTAPADLKTSGTGFWTAALVVGIALGGALLVPLVKKSPERKPERRDSAAQFDVTDLTDSLLVMVPNTPPGRPGTLTAVEETKLRELWALTMKVFGVDVAVEEVNGTETPTPASTTATPSIAESEKDGKKDKKKSRLNVFRRHKDDKSTDSRSSTPSGTGTSTPSDINSLSISAEDDKFGQHADFKAAIANTPPEELRRAFWSMVKHDHPDALLLRFLRARKWDVDKALVMMISTMKWRLDEMHVDDDIVKNGELKALEDTKSSDAKVKKNAEDFLIQLRMGKSFLHGLDKEGRPMCFVRARLHKAGEQTEESLERFTVYTIETARMLLRPPIDTATIVFDMTDFSMANMDYTPVKFMIKCFEANYPESLGTVLVFKAPWVFNAIWSIIRGWLDPVVAGKVHFAKTIDELANFVPRSQIPTELGGDEKWTYEYPEPVPGENAKMSDEQGKKRLEEERVELVRRYENVVQGWVHEGSSGENTDERRRERDQVAEEMRQNYWKLDPFVRARTLYDRMGVLSAGGQLAFYPQKKAEEAVPTKKVAETSADDLD